MLTHYFDLQDYKKMTIDGFVPGPVVQTQQKKSRIKITKRFIVKHKRKKMTNQRKRQHWDYDVGILPSNDYTNFSNSNSK